MYRLGPHPAEWLDRAVPLRFTFEGREVQGYSGDTITSALAAAGVPFVSRSFKYHRPRGILSFANHDSNTLFQVDGVPNVRGDVILLRAGMRVSAVNTFGGLAADKARILNRLGRWLPVGFYYKAFHSKRWFPRWERMFRHLTGLGAVTLDAAHEATAKRYGFCDVLVIGGGPSGMSAALAAAAAGARVALVDESVRLGGGGSGGAGGGGGSGGVASGVGGEDGSSGAGAGSGVGRDDGGSGTGAGSGIGRDDGGSGAGVGGRVGDLYEGEHQARRALMESVNSSPLISVLTATVAAGYYADHWVALAEPSRLTKMRARAVVFATGVIEQPAVFRNNDLPGVMLASGATRLLARHRVAVGRRVVMIAANLEAYVACLELHAQGIAVAAIVDLRATADVDLRGTAEDDEAAGACAALGMPILRGHAPYEAIAGSDGAVRALDVAPLAGSGRAASGARGHARGAVESRVGTQGGAHAEGRVEAQSGAHMDGRVEAAGHRRIECDAVLMSVGFAAATQLFLQAGGTTQFSEGLQQFVPQDLPAGVFVAGRMNGVYDFAARLADGRRAGSQAAAQAGYGSPSTAVVARGARCPSHRFPIIDHPAAKNFVDFDEDLQVKDLQDAAQEGFDSSELLKRYSTVGMGPSQGKHSNMNALRVLARVRGVGVEQLGLTTSRPMYHPVALKLLAGRSFNPERRTPIDALHASLGAVWMPAGNWRRPEYYAVAGESRAQSIDAEVRAVRCAVGLVDVGTLGKIEIHGPQAGEFLDRVYAGRFSDLRVGMTRYGLMLDESGVIIDDGVIARLAPDLFYFTTTTGGSATVFRELLRHNALWGFDCALVNVTGHRAAFNFAGPMSRGILQPLTGIDLKDTAFPFLGVRSGSIAGCAARLLRVGFVGEWGYEIHVAAGDAAVVWRALHDAGLPHGLRPFGVEAQRVLRLEKGHFIVGQDTDGLTDPFEANARWAVAMQKPFFIGQRSLRILEKRGPRQKLVGIELLDPERLPRECHLVIEQGEMAGRVTSVVRSRTLNKAIGLAMVAPELAAARGEIRIRADGEMLAARIVPTPFYDPTSSRQRMGAAA